MTVLSLAPLFLTKITTDGLSGVVVLPMVSEWTFPTGESFGVYKPQDGEHKKGSGLIFDSQGNLYGTAATGGAYGYGFVFEITP